MYDFMIREISSFLKSNFLLGVHQTHDRMMLNLSLSYPTSIQHRIKSCLYHYDILLIKHTLNI